MSISRASLGRGPAKVTFGGASFYSRDDIVSRFSPVWNPVPTSMYGQVDQTIKDRVYKVALRLWGAYENLAILFPSYVMAAQAGASIFGVTDTPLVILARNGDQITYVNAKITKVAALYLGVDSDLFAADVEFTAIIANSTNPETASAYYTVATGQSYTDSDFAKTNFKRVRFSGAWGSVTGFTTIQAQKGFAVSWDLDAQPLTADGYGTVDFTVGPNTMQGICKCIPIQPTLTQIETAARAQGTAFGALLSATAADLVLTGSGISVTLSGAAITEHGYAFGVTPLRVGEMTFKTTRGFAAGVPAAVGVMA